MKTKHFIEIYVRRKSYRMQIKFRHRKHIHFCLFSIICFSIFLKKSIVSKSDTESACESCSKTSPKSSKIFPADFTFVLWTVGSFTQHGEMRHFAAVIITHGFFPQGIFFLYFFFVYFRFFFLSLNTYLYIREQQKKYISGVCLVSKEITLQKNASEMYKYSLFLTHTLATEYYFLVYPMSKTLEKVRPKKQMLP